MNFFDRLNLALADFYAEHDADLAIYAGEVNRVGADLVAQLLREKEHKNLVLVLATYGGDSNAAFKIARTCQTAYKTLAVPGRNQLRANPDRGTFTVYVPKICKSAGTIITLGANAVMMDVDAELGPIDIQLRKQDEVGELTSTLTPVQAIQSLHRKMADAFVETFGTLRFDERSSFSSKMAGELAGNLIGALVGPISSQIDPYRLAETERMLRISEEYGEKLNVGNLKQGALQKLVHGYPSHGYVIDLIEAKTLFDSVNAPTDSVGRFGELLDFLWRGRETGEAPYVQFITPWDKGDEEDSTTDESTRKEDGTRGKDAAVVDVSGAADKRVKRKRDAE